MQLKSTFFKYLILLIIFSTSCQKRVINVLCIGDSITQGKLEGDTIKELSYRYWFWEKMDSAGYHLNMIGSNCRWFKQNPDKIKIIRHSPFTNHAFINKHEAFYGIKTGESFLGGFTHDSILYQPLKERILTYEKPDLALIHIGTNDANNDSLKTISYLKQIIEVVYHRNNKVNILLAKLNTPWVTFVNHAIEPLINELRTRYPDIKIHNVDMASGWVNCPEAKGAMTFDWAHPNVLGQKVMADKWFKAFKSLKDKNAPKFNPQLETKFLNDSTLSISWHKAIDNKYLAGYQLYINHQISNYRYAECGGFNKQAVALIPFNTYILKGVSKSKSYTIQLAAVDFANNITFSKETILIAK